MSGAVSIGANLQLKTVRLPSLKQVFGRRAKLGVVLRFGLPAMLAAFAGAEVLLCLSDQQPIASCTLGGRAFAVTPVKLVVASRRSRQRLLR